MSRQTENVAVKDLKIGDLVETPDGNIVRVLSLTLIYDGIYRIQDDYTFDLYNMEGDDIVERLIV